MGGTGRIEVRLRPRAGKSRVGGIREGVLEAWVTAPPVDGAANRALCELIAKRLGIARSRVSIRRGLRSRTKLVEVEGIDSAALAAAFVD